jgi:hypothetical protein
MDGYGGQPTITTIQTTQFAPQPTQHGRNDRENDRRDTRPKRIRSNQ